MDMTGYGPSLEVNIEVKGRYPTLGLTFSKAQDKDTILQQCNPANQQPEYQNGDNI